ncbi:type III-A CRISPR-associated RAMP protein Csm3 [Cyanobacterium aponinum]|uniref:type III-A CRISPR-associated RAMP protein Csm3 n=1 Tax=Cyanobacterium aponinum TaxID=379064 RepID=UPI00240D4888|nr:type III-A CRISPR-associated RAMP protein Csm3 [Cyanobacterium aponinum]
MTKEGYLPGSSMKGKLRSLLERMLNKPLNRSGGSGTYRYESDDTEDGYSDVQGNLVKFEGAKHCELSRVFGSTGKDCWIEKTVADSQQLDYKQTKTIEGKEYAKIKGRNYSARLIVRDAHLKADSAQRLQNIDTGLYMTEWKFENGIDRVTSAANPRQVERIPAGSVFEFEIVYTVEDETQVEKDLENIAIALKILEDDALGGHGSRGYGKINFTNFNIKYRTLDFYRQAITKKQDDKFLLDNIDNTDNLLERFQDVKGLLNPKQN